MTRSGETAIWARLIVKDGKTLVLRDVRGTSRWPRATLRIADVAASSTRRSGEIANHGCTLQSAEGRSRATAENADPLDVLPRTRACMNCMVANRANYSRGLPANRRGSPSAVGIPASGMPPARCRFRPRSRRREICIF